MTIVIRQPYPGVEGLENTWRLDHSDFKDVYRTTFAKGVITDFELAKDEDGSDKTDPLTVISKVKVRIGDGEESEDFIPLFFHPKPLYWDDPPEPEDSEEDIARRKATYFNEEEKYFEKAWQSFRCGDEVVVMLQENIPFAVIGFADGVPRMGENVFKVETTPTQEAMGYCYNEVPVWSYYKAFGATPPSPNVWNLGRVDNLIITSPNEGYNIEFEAPGNIPYDNICVTEKSKIVVMDWTLDDPLHGSSAPQDTIDWSSLLFYPDFVGYIGRCCPPLCPSVGYTGVIAEDAAFFVKSTHTYINLIYEYYWVVGPILFCQRNYNIWDTEDQSYYYAHWFRNWPTDTCVTAPALYAEAPDWTEGDPADCGYDSVEEIGESGSRDLTVDWTSVGGKNQATWVNAVYEYENQSLWQVEYYAAIYTPELWENPTIDDMIHQETLYGDWEYSSCVPYEVDSLKFFVPPHTKQELIDAEMWPEELV